MTTQSKRSVQNFLASMTAFVVTFAFGLFFTPYLVARLGVSAFGLVPLCFSLTMYLGFFAQTFSVTLNKELVATTNDTATYNRIFSNAIVACVVLAAAMTILAVICSQYVTSLIRVPPGYESAAKYLFAATGVGFAASILGIPFQAVAFSTNALFVMNLSQIGQSIGRIGLIIVLFFTLTPALQSVASAIIFGALIGLTLTILLSVRSRKSLGFALTDFDQKTISTLLFTSGGVVLMQIGTLLLVNVDILLINASLGAEPSGRYAALSQWGTILQGLGGSAASIFTARIMQLYHAGDRDELNRYIEGAMMFTAAFIALPAGFVFGASPQLLDIWLGPRFANDWPTLAALTISGATNCIFIPLIGLLLASGRIYRFGLVMIAAGLLNLAAIYVSLRFTVAGGAGVALCVAAALLTKNIAFVIPQSRNLVGLPNLVAYRALGFAIAWGAIAAAIAHGVATYLHPNSFLQLLCCGFITAALFIVVVRLTAPSHLLDPYLREIGRFRLRQLWV